MLNPHHFHGDAVIFYTKMYDKRKGEEKGWMRRRKDLAQKTWNFLIGIG